MQEPIMPGNLSDINKYLIDKLDRIDAKIEEYFRVQEEKITNLRIRFAIATVIISLATTVVSDRLKANLQPALPMERAQTKR